MKSKFHSTRLTALPLQVVEVPEGVILKRGSTEVKIAGHGAVEAVRTLLDATRIGASPRDLCKLFTPFSRPLVEELIRNLVERQLLVPSNDHLAPYGKQESPMDIFYWHFGESTERVNARFNKARLVIIGVNFIARQLAAALAASGHSNFEIVDHPEHRNMGLFDDHGVLKQEDWPARVAAPRVWKDDERVELGDCAIVTSDFGDQNAARRWNRFCLERGIQFMPILLKNMVGYVGPLIVPGETPCYECLYSRQRSHATEGGLESVTDPVAFEAKHVVGFYPSMATVLGDIATFELARFYARVLPPRKSGSLIEISLLAASMTERQVLKVPRCPVCSPLLRTPCTNLSKATFAEEGGVQGDYSQG